MVPKPQFGSQVGPWRKHFAWLPCRTFDGCHAWLRPLVRRRIQKHHFLNGGADFWWQYAFPSDVTDDRREPGGGERD